MLVMTARLGAGVAHRRAAVRGGRLIAGWTRPSTATLRQSGTRAISHGAVILRQCGRRMNLLEPSSVSPDVW